MEQLIKNMDYSRAASLANSIEWLPGQIVSRTLIQSPAVGMTLFAIPKDEGISAHKSSGDAMVLILAGKLEITIDDNAIIADKGDYVIMPAGRPHAVKALEDAKMFLVVIFPQAR